MTVASDAYIRFVFNDFDVYQEENDDCDGDAVELFDFDSSGVTAKSLGRYCNTFRPPAMLETGWNVLQLDFYTDADMARKGFTASYTAITHDFSDNVAWSENSLGMVPVFGHMVEAVPFKLVSVKESLIHVLGLRTKSDLKGSS